MPQKGSKEKKKKEIMPKYDDPNKFKNKKWKKCEVKWDCKLSLAIQHFIFAKKDRSTARQQKDKFSFIKAWNTKIHRLMFIDKSLCEKKEAIREKIPMREFSTERI